MKSQENIQQLIALLSQSSIEDYNAILNNFNFNSIDFKPFESWSQQKYTRNCLYRDVNFEVILLCWEKGQETVIHGHDGEDCWVYLLEGEMEEVFFNVEDQHLRKVGSQKVLPHQLTFMNDNIGFHKLKNSYEGKSISLHVYAKPIEHCVSYNETSQQFIERQLTYDTYKQLIVKD
ncbi:cysteine dioxygenase family protein [uncultured Psychroserpens sp.]|uniref:cysteine dioxygenase n=1 Tax=uncultured Psychroserpens sp. TaxID=255436 RepID=UPI0026074880|nr:cysteine dioxygenase family protein [uncultured Psychroserpens sp.]